MSIVALQALHAPADDLSPGAGPPRMGVRSPLPGTGRGAPIGAHVEPREEGRAPELRRAAPLERVRPEIGIPPVAHASDGMDFAPAAEQSLLQVPALVAAGRGRQSVEVQDQQPASGPLLAHRPHAVGRNARPFRPFGAG